MEKFFWAHEVSLSKPKDHVCCNLHKSCFWGLCVHVDMEFSFAQEFSFPWTSFPGPALLSSLETLHKNSASLSKFEVHVSWPCSSNLIAFQISKRRGSETRMGGSLDGVLQPFSEHTEEA
ncbi:hypothetical protein H0E87_027043 [Populus deltoides]|uniref:Uncharacterized protein n=1 Tax=Populus deltoides TaxID=3696 RepID=A0A8T2WW16_POPDE|nr:hypothetical protein H0E87_027043 [Populus deltoides]